MLWLGLVIPFLSPSQRRKEGRKTQPERRGRAEPKLKQVIALLTKDRHEAFGVGPAGLMLLIGTLTATLRSRLFHGGPAGLIHRLHRHSLTRIVLPIPGFGQPS
jgi:hypothetical protein